MTFVWSIISATIGLYLMFAMLNLSFHGYKDVIEQLSRVIGG